MSVVLKDNGLLKFVKNPETAPIYSQQLIHCNNNGTKTRRIILEGVKDHIIPHLHQKKTTKDMWKTILDLY